MGGRGHGLSGWAELQRVILGAEADEQELAAIILLNHVRPIFCTTTESTVLGIIEITGYLIYLCVSNYFAFPWFY